MAVVDHGHVVVDQRTPLGYDHHLEPTAGLDDALPGVTAALVVAHHAEGADGLHASDVALRVLVTGDHCLSVALGAVQDRAGREEAWPDLFTGPDHLGVCEDRGGIAGGVVRRGYPVGEVRQEGPVGLGRDAARLSPHMGVHVHDPRYDRLARDVHPECLGRYRHPVGRTQGGNAIAGHHDGAPLDHAAVRARVDPERHDACIHKSDHARRHVAGSGESNIEPTGFRVGRLVGAAAHEAEGLSEIPREVFRPQGPMQGSSVSRPVQILPGVVRYPGDGKALLGGAERDRSPRARKGRQVGAEALGERDPLPIG